MNTMSHMFNELPPFPTTKKETAATRDPLLEKSVRMRELVKDSTKTIGWGSGKKKSWKALSLRSTYIYIANSLIPHDVVAVGMSFAHERRWIEWTTCSNERSHLLYTTRKETVATVRVHFCVDSIYIYIRSPYIYLALSKNEGKKDRTKKTAHRPTFTKNDGYMCLSDWKRREINDHLLFSSSVSLSLSKLYSIGM